MHAHNAIEVDISLDDTGIDMTGAGGEALRGAPGVIVRCDSDHQLSIPGPKVAIIYVDALAPLGAGLLDWLGERNIAALPRELIAAARPSFRALFEPDAGLGEASAACSDLLSKLAPDPERPAVDWRVRKAIAFLEARLDDPPPLAKVAEHVNLSESRLSHVFKQQMRLPVRRYVLWLRLRQALLAALDGQTMAESAHAAGFSDAAHFTRTCQRMFGLPPTAFAPVDAVFVA